MEPGIRVQLLDQVSRQPRTAPLLSRSCSACTPHAAHLKVLHRPLSPPQRHTARRPPQQGLDVARLVLQNLGSGRCWEVSKEWRRMGEKDGSFLVSCMCLVLPTAQS